MKRLVILLPVVWFIPLISFAQVRGTEPRPPAITDPIHENRSVEGLGLFDPARFHMSHRLSMSYLAFGSQGLSMTMYTNAIRYQIADPLTVSADVSIVSSPLGSLSKQWGLDNAQVYLSRAQLDYKPSKDVQISLQYRHYPMDERLMFSRYGQYGYPPYSPLFHESEWP